jgi:hypothetical protein
MVICSECGARVPPKTVLCPKCNAPVDATGVGPRTPKKQSMPWRLIVLAVVVLFAAGYGAYWLAR